MTGKGTIYARRHIAQALELTERHVKRLTDDGVIEEHSPGYYRFLPAVQGYLRYLKSQLSDDGQTSDYNVEKARLTRLKREDAELDIQVKRNELHRSEDVEFIVTNMIVAFKAKLEVLPFKVLPAIVGLPDGANKADRISEILKSAVDEALNELSGYDPGQFDEESYLEGLDDSGA